MSYLHLVSTRLLRAAAVALGVSFLAFVTIRMVPGDPALVLLGDNATPDQIDQLRSDLNLDKSVVGQYFDWLSAAARGDLGSSIFTRQPVADTLRTTMPVTLWLTSCSLLVAIVLGVPLGSLGGVARTSRRRRLFGLATASVLAVPPFLSGLVLLLVFGQHWEMFPVAGYEARFPANLEYLVLPSVAAGVTIAMLLARILARTVRSTIHEEHVETAVAWGLGRWTITWSNYLKPSLAPVIGLMGYVFGVNLAASVVLETVFTLPGVGTYLLRGVLARDYPVVQGTLFAFGLVVVAVHLAADLIAGWIDPRTRTM